MPIYRSKTTTKAWLTTGEALAIRQLSIQADFASDVAWGDAYTSHVCTPQRDIEVRCAMPFPVSSFFDIPIRIHTGDTLIAVTMSIYTFNNEEVVLSGRDAIFITPFPDGDIEAAITWAREAPARLAALRALEAQIRYELDPYDLDNDFPAQDVMYAREPEPYYYDDYGDYDDYSEDDE